ncbi:hypothetical protein [Anaerorhabdus sp.]|uniref:hypothetical protein n=1 Tax=Anaerorhabdus sp. TaxID=1872524 RepID=UPI002FCBAF1B
MRKIIAIISTVLLLVGCSTTPVEKTTDPEVKTEPVVLKVIAPKGATSLPLIPVVLDESADVTFVDGTDVIQAAFVNPNPEYNVIIAPTNLGTKLASAGKTNYKMLGIITWGNLYLVGESEEALNNDGELAAFGEGTVPGLIFSETVKNIKPNVTYYNSVTDAQAALLSGNANMALLAEPAATATIAKAKEQGKELQIIKDLQKEFEAISGTVGYPQAAIYVLEDKYTENIEVYDQFISTINDYLSNIDESTMDQLVVDIDTITPEELGIPNSQIITKTWDRMNIRYVPANESIEQLQAFLQLFGIEKIENTIIK